MKRYRMAWQNLLFVGVGGFLGANARYLISTFLNDRTMQSDGWHIPLGTAFVNITGSLLLAIFLVWVQRRITIVPNSAKLLIGTGFFGAYTTFSTFANESVALWKDNALQAIGYIILTNSLCLIGVILGIWLANRWFTV